LSADINRFADAELERQGFTTERAMAVILNRIGPIIPYYQQIPQLRDLVTGLEEAARGTRDSQASRGLNQI
jgi:hypothetical protein